MTTPDTTPDTTPPAPELGSIEWLRAEANEADRVYLTLGAVGEATTSVNSLAQGLRIAADEMEDDENELLFLTDFYDGHK